MKVETVLKDVIEGVSNTYGEEFLDKIIETLAGVVGADFCFVARVDESITVSKTIATFAHGEHVDNFEYALADTPCAEVACDKVSIYPKNVVALFPKDHLLAEMNIEAYIGTSLKNREGKILGLVVALFHNEVKNPEPIHTLYQMFAGRISAELDRQEKADELKEINETLEDRVKAATKRLAEQEKFASLGRLVAGIAHEINTPLGLGVTAASMMHDSITKIQSELQANTLTQSCLNKELDRLGQAAQISQTNLFRAADLIKNFKKVAVEQSNLEKSHFNLQELLNSLLESLYPVIKKHPVTITNLVNDDIVINSYAGDYYQVFSNLIMNSIQHAFTGEKKGEIQLTTVADGNNIIIKVKDDGNGIKAEHLKLIFEPFFTTKRPQGSTGLGLNIVYNIVNQKLHGMIVVHSQEGKGTEFVIKLPLSG